MPDVVFNKKISTLNWRLVGSQESEIGIVQKSEIFFTVCMQQFLYVRLFKAPTHVYDHFTSSLQLKLITRGEVSSYVY